MDIIKLIGVGLISVVVIIIIRQYKPEYAIYVSLTAGIIILSMTFDGFSKIINLVESLADKVSISNKFVTILLKITGISILAEFACNVCKDCGETAIASKIDLGSKVIIISASIPIISSLLEVVVKVMP